MSKNTRKDAAAEIRTLREKNVRLMSEIAASRFDSAGAREEKKNSSDELRRLNPRLRITKKLLDEAMVLCANVIKDATKAVGAAEKYRAKMKFWRFSFFAVLAGVILFCVTRPFLNY